MSQTPSQSVNAKPKGTTSETRRRPLTPEAKRALAEAEERRAAQKNQASDGERTEAKELGGRKGPDPVRFGDWENGGIVSDF